jgi:hypothetical protein
VVHASIETKRNALMVSRVLPRSWEYFLKRSSRGLCSSYRQTRIATSSALAAAAEPWCLSRQQSIYGANEVSKHSSSSSTRITQQHTRYSSLLKDKHTAFTLLSENKLLIVTCARPAPNLIPCGSPAAQLPAPVSALAASSFLSLLHTPDQPHPDNSISLSLILRRGRHTAFSSSASRHCFTPGSMR